MDYMDGLRLVLSTNNSVPQMMAKRASGSRKRNVLYEQEAGELLATGKAVVKNKSRLEENAIAPNNSRGKTFDDSPKPVVNQSLTSQPTCLQEAANSEKIYEFIDFQVGFSAAKKNATGEEAFINWRSMMLVQRNLFIPFDCKL